MGCRLTDQVKLACTRREGGVMATARQLPAAWMTGVVCAEKKGPVLTKGHITIMRGECSHCV